MRKNMKREYDFSKAKRGLVMPVPEPANIGASRCAGG
jgi:hypothetical protein